MKIIVDADACPVKEIIVKVAKETDIDVLMFFDTSHVYSDGYSKVFTIDKGRDSVDFALIPHIKKDDIVVTQDYGVASMALTKGAHAINQNGLIYTNENIDMLLHTRYISQKIRKSGGRTKGPKKRVSENDKIFESNLIKLISKKN